MKTVYPPQTKFARGIKTEKVPILDIFSPKTILMFRVGLKQLG